jgi:hypothetical protein
MQTDGTWAYQRPDARVKWSTYLATNSHSVLVQVSPEFLAPSTMTEKSLMPLVLVISSDCGMWACWTTMRANTRVGQRCPQGRDAIIPENPGMATVSSTQTVERLLLPSVPCLTPVASWSSAIMLAHMPTSISTSPPTHNAVVPYILFLALNMTSHVKSTKSQDKTKCRHLSSPMR